MSMQAGLKKNQSLIREMILGSFFQRYALTRSIYHNADELYEWKIFSLTLTPTVNSHSCFYLWQKIHKAKIHFHTALQSKAEYYSNV